MGKKTKGLWKIKTLIPLVGKKAWRLLDKKSKNCRKAQEEILLDIINYAKDTEYGKKYNFDQIKTFEDFQKNVPVNTYGDLEPYILRHTKGEENILFPGKPIMYATTSGTTENPKWIPITEKYYKEAYKGLSHLWFYSYLKENPNIFDGPYFSIVGKAYEGYTEDGTPYGSFSGHLNTNIPKFLEAIRGIPTEIQDIDHYYSKYYALMRFALEKSIRLIVTGNPSTLLEIVHIANSRFEELAEDIEKGTLSQELTLTPEMRKALEKSCKPNPERAEELRQLKKEHGHLLPKHYWPELVMINTWKCGNSGLYLQHTKGYFPKQTKIRAFGYLATEARASIILHNDQMPAILSCHLVFFEFVKKDEKDLENPRFYLADELEDGEEYFIYVTTSGGLYRYDMNDLLRVDGFYNDFPRMTFIQKGAGITTLTGEKLHESQYIAALKATQAELGLHANFHIGFADFESSRYHIFVEFEDNPNDAEGSLFIKTVDHELKVQNLEYKSKRESLRLGTPVLHLLEKDSFKKFKASCMAKGYRDGQFKLTHLMVDERRMAMFNELKTGSEMTFEEDPATNE